MKGFHVYYLNKKDESYYSYIDYLCQLCSIILWKKNYGNIELFCNDLFLEETNKWELSQYYDKIDTELFENIPYKENLKIYWSFPKIHAINKISQYCDKFCVIDTDFWFYKSIKFEKNHNLVGYHRESLVTHEKSPYISPEIFNLSNNYDWSEYPVNCAFLYFNSRKLISEWYKECRHVIENTKNTDSINSSHTVFIEQRLVTTICKKLNLEWSSLIENFYLPFAEKDGSEWEPQIGYNEENLEKFQNIKHIWGLKKMYDDEIVRNMVLSFCKLTLDIYYPEWIFKNRKLHMMLQRDVTDSVVLDYDTALNISNLLYEFKNGISV